jgi:hypothetical protein
MQPNYLLHFFVHHLGTSKMYVTPCMTITKEVPQCSHKVTNKTNAHNLHMINVLSFGIDEKHGSKQFYQDT